MSCFDAAIKLTEFSGAIVMPFPWPTKKDHLSEMKVDMPDLSSVADGATSEELENLTEQLGRLGQLLDQANGQVAAYLLRRESQAATATGEPGVAALADRIDSLGKRLEQLAAATPAREGVAAVPVALPVQADASKANLGPVLERLDQLNAKIDALGELAAGSANRNTKDAAGAAIDQLRAAILEMKETLAVAFGQLRQRVNEGLSELTESMRPQAPAATEEPEFFLPGGDDWERAILGPVLAENPALRHPRQQLLRGVLDGDAGACSLAGQLLVFQSAPPEKMPALLKDIGEAYYRWQPKTSPGADELEESLAAWLQRACDNAGIANTIELVDPGERFDSTRHTTTGRGVEIAEVYGWIVLRDNGKVYTKASVAVK